MVPLSQKLESGKIFQTVKDQNLPYEKKLIKLREQINKLFFERQLSKSMIARKKKVSRNFVIRWTQSPEQDCSSDQRGWPKGKRRKWSRKVERRIRALHRKLSNDPRHFFSGATAIEQQWRRQYPQEPPPPLRTIGQMLSDLGLATYQKRKRNKGASHYLCYPEHTIYHLLGGRVLEVDFVGQKYLTGRTEPLHFMAFSFKKEPRLRYFQRVSAQTAESFIDQTRRFFHRFERPDFIKVDNCLATIGSASAKRAVSQSMKFLLENQVIPIFAVPRKPFSQASVEGNNSVFSRKFWNRIAFRSLKEVDQKLEWFNQASQHYTHYRPLNGSSQQQPRFMPKVYFLRQVKAEDAHQGQAFIDVLNEKVFLPKSYINYFVLAEWDLQVEQLLIHFQAEQQPKVIKKLSFKINEESKRRIQKLLK
jgi:transposase